MKHLYVTEVTGSVETHEVLSLRATISRILRERIKNSREKRENKQSRHHSLQPVEANISNY